MELRSTVDRHAFLTGFIGIGVLVALVIGFSGAPLNYIDPASLVLVIGGTLAVGLMERGVSDLSDTVSAIRRTVRWQPPSYQRRAQYLLRLASEAKKEGRVVLDSEASIARDPFLKLGLELVADGQRADEIRRILDHEAQSVFERNQRSIATLESLAGYAPALGLIGTLLGLVQMLGNLGSPAELGAGMALALLTTLYGALFAHVVLMPLAGRIRARTEREQLLKRITVEGIASLAHEESQIVMEQRLSAFAPLLRAG